LFVVIFWCFHANVMNVILLVLQPLVRYAFVGAQAGSVDSTIPMI